MEQNSQIISHHIHSTSYECGTRNHRCLNIKLLCEFPHGINLHIQAVIRVLPNFEKNKFLTVSRNKKWNSYSYFLVLVQIQIIQANFCSEKARMPLLVDFDSSLYELLKKIFEFHNLLRHSHYLTNAPSPFLFKWNLLSSHWNKLNIRK